MTASKQHIRQCVQDAINEVLHYNGEEPIQLQDGMRPVLDIDKFDSLSSLEATSVVCTKLNIDCPSPSFMICPIENRALKVPEIVNRIAKLVGHNE